MTSKLWIGHATRYCQQTTGADVPFALIQKAPKPKKNSGKIVIGFNWLKSWSQNRANLN